MTVKQKELIGKFKKSPGYMGKGSGYLAQALKCSKEDIFFVKNFLRKQNEDVPAESSVETIKGNEKGDKEIVLKSDHPLSPQEIDNLAQVDNITSKVTNYWLKSQASNIYTYSVQVKKIDNSLELSIEDFIENFQLPELNYKKNENNSENFLIISLSDLHFNKRSYIDETEDILNEASFAVQYLINAADSFHFSDVYLVLGNDFFNHDTYFKTTTKGTPQDSEGAGEDSFYNALTFCTDTINTICAMGYNVKVFAPKGNHDAAKSQYLQAALKKIYEGSSAVEINFDYKDRQYFKRGDCLFMLTHGDNVKQQKMPILFSTEQAKNWGCKFKTILTGHTHKKGEVSFISSDEDYGIDIKVCPSLSKTDRWHYENGYIGNKRRAIAFLYSEEYGELANFNSLPL